MERRSTRSAVPATAHDGLRKALDLRDLKLRAFGSDAIDAGLPVWETPLTVPGWALHGATVQIPIEQHHDWFVVRANNSVEGEDGLENPMSPRLEAGP